MLKYKFNPVWDQALNNCLDKIDTGVYNPLIHFNYEKNKNIFSIHESDNVYNCFYIVINSFNNPYPCALIEKHTENSIKALSDDYQFRPSIKTLLRVKKLFKKIKQEECKQKLLELYGELL